MIYSLENVKERLLIFQEQYNEVVRGAKMDMVRKIYLLLTNQNRN